jgi:hypothetical protein
MPTPFKGITKLDVRDSKPDWDAFLEKKAPADAPNVLVILYDDTVPWLRRIDGLRFALMRCGNWQ